MIDLLSSLYSYRPRDSDKSNLEDWLTECLAGVLRSLSGDQWLLLLPRLSQAPAVSLRQAILAAAPRVETQVGAGAFGRPDLVVFLRDQPFLLFENKVSHCIDAAKTKNGETKHQLHRYAEWLATHEDPTGFQKSLIFLTHITVAPDDFLVRGDEASVYAGLHRHVESWGELGRALLEITRDEGPRSLSHELAQSLIHFLKEQGMANEFPQTTDFAALELFLRFGAPLENLLTQMWRQTSKAANSSNQFGWKIEAEHGYGRYGVYRFVNKVPRVGSTSMFLATGIWYPEIGEGWTSDDLGGHEPRGPHVYLLFGDDGDNVFAEVKGAPGEGWMRPSSDFLLLRPLHSFVGAAEDRARQILDWVGGEATKLRAFLLAEDLTT